LGTPVFIHKDFSPCSAPSPSPVLPIEQQKTLSYPDPVQVRGSLGRLVSLQRQPSDSAESLSLLAAHLAVHRQQDYLPEPSFQSTEPSPPFYSRNYISSATTSTTTSIPYRSMTGMTKKVIEPLHSTSSSTLSLGPASLIDEDVSVTPRQSAPCNGALLNETTNQTISGSSSSCYPYHHIHAHKGRAGHHSRINSISSLATHGITRKRYIVYLEPTKDSPLYQTIREFYDVSARQYGRNEAHMVSVEHDIFLYSCR
jgi:hypothetical protein